MSTLITSSTTSTGPKSLAHFATLVFDTPWAIIPKKAEVILASIGQRLVDSNLINAETFPKANITDGSAAIDLASPDDRRNYAVTNTGIAIIPITGALMQKSTWMSAYSGMSSYESIERDLLAALDDTSVKAILFDVNSPGGETHGCFELSDKIYKARGKKPIWGIANNLAASAALCLISAVDKGGIYVTRTGALGSVGVVAMHTDTSGADAQCGLKYTFVYAGEHKIDGNSHNPLSDGAKASIQAEVDRQAQIFIQTVARNRTLDAKKVAGTQAGIYFAGDNVGLFADQVGTKEDAIKALEQKIGIVGFSSVSGLNAEATAPVQINEKGVVDPMLRPASKHPVNVNATGSGQTDVELEANTEVLNAGASAHVAAATAAVLNAGNKAGTAAATVAGAAPCDDGDDPLDKEEATAAAPAAPAKEKEKEKEAVVTAPAVAAAAPVAAPAASAPDANAPYVQTMADAKEINQLCTIAGISSNKYIGASITPDQVREKIHEKRVNMQNTNISNATTAGAAKPVSPLASIEAKARQLQVTHRLPGGKRMSIEQAKSMLLRDNPTDYQSYKEELMDMARVGSRADQRDFIAQCSKILTAGRAGGLSDLELAMASTGGATLPTVTA